MYTFRQWTPATAICSCWLLFLLLFATVERHFCRSVGKWFHERGCERGRRARRRERSRRGKGYYRRWKVFQRAVWRRGEVQVGDDVIVRKAGRSVRLGRRFCWLCAGCLVGWWLNGWFDCWLVVWFVGGWFLIGWLVIFGWLGDWLVGWVVGWLINDWLDGWLIGWLLGGLGLVGRCMWAGGFSCCVVVEWLFGGWMVAWLDLVGGLVAFFFWLVRWWFLVAWLIGWQGGWLGGWLVIGWMLRWLIGGWLGSIGRCLWAGGFGCCMFGWLVVWWLNGCLVRLLVGGLVAWLFGLVG